MKRLVFFLVLVLCLSCSHNEQKKISQEDSDVSVELVREIDLPNWFLNPPSENVTIGIAATNIYNPQITEDKIKENASILAARKESSIVIAKMKMRENQDIPTPILSEFRMQVARDIAKLKKDYVKCEILQRNDLLGMSIGLVGKLNSEEILDTLTSKVSRQPLWYNDNRVVSSDNWIVSSGKYTAVDMVTAYNGAYNEAVYNLISGIKPQVSASIINSPDYQEKFVEIDASLVIENMVNTRNSLVLRKSDNPWVYDAYVELRWQANYSLQKIEVKR